MPPIARSPTALPPTRTFPGATRRWRPTTASVNPAGYLQAGGIQLLAGSNIFIQNTGTATDFAGLTVGGGGLLVGRYQAITTQSGDPRLLVRGYADHRQRRAAFRLHRHRRSQMTLRTYSYAGGTNSAGQIDSRRRVRPDPRACSMPRARSSTRTTTAGSTCLRTRRPARISTHSSRRCSRPASTP